MKYPFKSTDSHPYNEYYTSSISIMSNTHYYQYLRLIFFRSFFYIRHIMRIIADQVSAKICHGQSTIIIKRKKTEKRLDYIGTKREKKD
jgi:hypothetical protein